MCNFIKGGYFKLLFLLLMILSIVTFIVNDAKSKKMNPISHRIEKIFEKTKTICFGRFLIDVPDASTVVFGPTQAPFSIKFHSIHASELDQLVEEKLSRLEPERYRARGELRGNQSMLGKVIKGGLPNQKIFFGISPGAGDFYLMESYVISGGKIFVYKADSPGDKESYESELLNLNFASKFISHRAEGEIPQSAGVCVDGGFVRESSALTHENFTLGVRLTEFPDVHLSIATTKKEFFHDSDALEPRLRAAEEEAKLSGFGSWYSRIKILRQGNATIEHWNGYEVLARKPAQAGQKDSYEFAFLSQGEPKNSYLPLLDIKLHSGVSDNKAGVVRSSISDDDAVVLWDKLTQSIRTRPIK